MLAADGARVALVARTRRALEEIAESLEGEPVVVECDVTDHESVAAAAPIIRDAFGGSPDIIINNAGAFRVAPLHEMLPEDFVASIRTNLIAPFLILHEFLRGMRERGSGHVVTIGSLGDRTIFTENGAYSASKFGLRAMHEVLRAELKGTGVHATLIAPGSVSTALWDGIDTESGELDMPTRSQMLDTAPSRGPFNSC